MTKKSRQKLKYLENEKNFEGEIKSIFHHFENSFSLRTESASLMTFYNDVLNSHVPDNMLFQ